MCKWALTLVAAVALLAKGSDSAANVHFTPTDTCTPQHQQTVLDAVLACQPRPTVVELSFPDHAVTGSNSIEQVRDSNWLLQSISSYSDLKPPQ